MGGQALLLVALVFFGGKQLPEMAQGLGQGRRACPRASAGLVEDAAEPAAPSHIPCPGSQRPSAVPSPLGGPPRAP
jgi:hypothetical protein